MRLLAAFAAIFLLPIVLSSAAQAEMRINSSNPEALAFVMEVGAPTTPAELIAKSEEPIFEQPLRPEAAIRTTEDFTVPYVLSTKTTGIAIDLHKPAAPSVTVPAGSVLVMAVGVDGEYFCLAGAAREEGEFSGPHDVGVCLRDADHDKVFELARATDLAPKRVRVPFEINCLCHTTDSTVHVGYTELNDADIPQAKLEVAYHYRIMFVNGRPFLSHELCWPPSLIASTASAYSQKDCASLNWKEPDDHMDVGAAVPINWGPVKLSVTRNDDRSLNVKTEQPLQPGKALLVQIGYEHTTSTVWQRGIFQLRRLIAKPVQNSTGDQ